MVRNIYWTEGALGKRREILTAELIAGIKNRVKKLLKSPALSDWVVAVTEPWCIVLGIQVSLEMQNAVSGSRRLCVYCACANWENYWRPIVFANTIWGRIQFEGEIYSRKYGIHKHCVPIWFKFVSRWLLTTPHCGKVGTTVGPRLSEPLWPTTANNSFG